MLNNGLWVSMAMGYHKMDKMDGLFFMENPDLEMDDN